MNFNIKILNLYKNLRYTAQKNVKVNKTETFWRYRNGVEHNDLEPCKENYLLDEQFMGWAIKNDLEQKIDIDYTAICAGRYLFLQGLIPQNEKDLPSLFMQAAEELYLESLWQELQLDAECVYMRKLEEDGRQVFQFFRAIL